MKTEISKDKTHLIIKVPLKARRFNPYNHMATGDGDTGEMNNIVGIVCGDEIGFAHWIDMDYKGKEDQISTIFYQSAIEEKEFEQLCKDLGIDFYEYPKCSKCGKPIFGACTWGDKGPLCFDCEHKEENE